MNTLLKRIGGFAVVCAAILCISSGAFAQGFGSISGTVTDPTGAVVPDATVTATQAGTGIVTKTTSNTAGTYVFPTLAPSVYSLAGRYKSRCAFTIPVNSMDHIMGLTAFPSAKGVVAGLWAFGVISTTLSDIS